MPRELPVGATGPPSTRPTVSMVQGKAVKHASPAALGEALDIQAELRDGRKRRRLRGAALIVGALSLVAAAAAGLVVALSGGTDQSPQISQELLIDGTAGEWDAKTRLHPPFWKQPSSKSAGLFATFDAATDRYFFFVHATEGAEIDRSTSAIYFDVDQNKETGTLDDRFFAPKGYEVYILLGGADAADPPSLWRGCPPLARGFNSSCAEKLVTLPADDFALVPAQNGVELSFSRDMLVNATGWRGSADLDLSLHLQQKGASKPAEVVAPDFFLDAYAFYADLGDQVACVETAEVRGAVVFSNHTRERFFSDLSYSQLFMSMQNQMFQAGIPHDRVYIEELLDVNRFCHYRVLVIPYLAYVDKRIWAKLRKSLFLLIHVHGVGLVTSGDFVTNDVVTEDPLPGDPYHVSESLLGIGDDSPVFYNHSGRSQIRVKDVTDMFHDQRLNELLMDESLAGPYSNMYVRPPGSAFEVRAIASQTFPVDEDVVTRNAILASRLPMSPITGRPSGTIIHFSTIEVLANSDFVWRAAQLVVSEYAGRGALGRGAAKFGVQMTRMDSIFFMRNDVDQSMYNTQAVALEPKLLSDFVRPWYERWGVVGSYYVNVGDEPAKGKFTDWNFSRPLYQEYIAIENEIGSHSFNHPHNINAPGVDLEYEFNQAQLAIMGNMSLPRLGTAQPGAGDTLATAYKVQKFKKTTYWSGGFSGGGAGYPGGFGFLNADPGTMVYLAPNMYFDFTLSQWLKLPPEESEEIWLDQFRQLTRFANCQILLWPVHDYGPTRYFFDGKNSFFNSTLYTESMFESLLALAYNSSTEFVTGMALSDRIRTFDATQLLVERVGDHQYNVTVEAGSVPHVPEPSLGHFALSIHKTQRILSAGGHFAFRSNKVFLPRQGGTFSITTGPARPPGKAAGSGGDSDVEFKLAFDSDTSEPGLDVTRIVSLAMRMDLVSVVGDGASLSFQVQGHGKVKVILSSIHARAGCVSLDNATRDLVGPNGTATLTWVEDGAALEFGFREIGLHQVSLLACELERPQSITLSPTMSTEQRAEPFPVIPVAAGGGGFAFLAILVFAVFKVKSKIEDRKAKVALRTLSNADLLL